MTSTPKAPHFPTQGERLARLDAYDAYLHVYITARTGRHVDVSDGVDTAHRVAAALAVNEAAAGIAPRTRAEFDADHARMMETAEATHVAVARAKAEAFDAAWCAAFAGAANSPDCHGSMTEALTNAAKALGVSLD